MDLLFAENERLYTFLDLKKGNQEYRYTADVALESSNATEVEVNKRQMYCCLM